MLWHPLTYLREETEKALRTLLWQIQGFQEIDWHVVMKDPNWAWWPSKWEPNVANHGESSEIVGSFNFFLFVRVVSKLPSDTNSLHVLLIRINIKAKQLPPMRRWIQSSLIYFLCLYNTKKQNHIYVYVYKATKWTMISSRELSLVCHQEKNL